METLRNSDKKPTKDEVDKENCGGTGTEKKGEEEKKEKVYEYLDNFVPTIDPDQAEYFSRLKYSDHKAWWREESYM